MKTESVLTNHSAVQAAINYLSKRNALSKLSNPVEVLGRTFMMHPIIMHDKKPFVIRIK